MFNPAPAIRWFNLCSMMEWSHLPREGALGDQDPEFLQAMQYIASEQGKFREEEDRRREAEAKRGR